MASNGATADADKPASFYDNEDNIRKLCNFLRSRGGVAVREALLMEKRVHYLKGMLLSRSSSIAICIISYF